ncbi:hypothetical protein F5144DRAFT_308096 [Chaetomium tenue]|uniref:Uncharacterized protein n=1 Tax=Chaetomium tenue TaxID=1854479 RepID=A0ACB7P5E1_9PEZI|nr:hypothetical protein F5144DRAFT_308096 [Chaetomium globosum]
MGLMTMAQHRQAPRQFKEEPGHDSVSDIHFSNSCDTSTHRRQFRCHFSPSVNAVVPSRFAQPSFFDRVHTQLARDKSISQEVSPLLRREVEPHAPAFAIPLARQPWQAS